MDYALLESDNIGSLCAKRPVTAVPARRAR